jgi:hypothetical protein
MPDDSPAMLHLLTSLGALLDSERAALEAAAHLEASQDEAESAAQNEAAAAAAARSGVVVDPREARRAAEERRKRSRKFKTNR